MRKVIFILIITLVSFSSCKHMTEEEAKVESLLKQMTLEEKVGQMNQIDGRWMADDLEGDIRAGKIGSVLNHFDPEEVRELQRLAVEESRLGIPVLFARDIIHGFHTIFPIPLGQSTTWNTDLIEAAAHQTALEATQTGIRWTFSPMVDISRDPRWGRIAEGYGEDTYLAEVMGAATVRGYQGNDLTNPRSLAACVKHFCGYSVSEGGRDYNTTWIPEVQLRDTYLPPFKACCDAGSASIMCSFNDINGVPPSANRHLCVDILRNEWNYDGLMVSDWGSIHDLIAHGVAADNDEATAMGINAQISMDMAGYNYQKNLVDLVRAGKIKESDVDVCVREILRMKYRLGLFENPYPVEPQNGADKPVYFTPEALAVAQAACEESAVLLKNNGVLPLFNDVAISRFNASTAPKVLICGPLANNQHDQNGTWCFDAIDSMTVTPMMAFQNPERYNLSPFNYQLSAQSGFHWSREVNADNVAKLHAMAQQSDVILFFAGEESMISGEAKTRAHLDLPGDQTEQLKALKSTGKPVVMVVMAGRPLCLDKEMEMADAVVYAYHGGTMQGPALYNVLTGVTNPSGHLTTTFPHAVGQIPFYYNRKNTGRPTWGPKEHNFWNIPVNAGQFSIGSSTYWLEYGLESAFPFGYGLSYTTFDYSPVTLSDTIFSLAPLRGEGRGKGSLVARATITNTGKVAGKEVAQLYIRDMVGSICRPIRELKGYEKFELQPGESRTVEFEITEEMLAYWHYADGVTPGADGGYVCSAEPGDFQVFIAPNADAGLPAAFTLQK